MNPAKATSIEVLSCIPSSFGRLRTHGNANREMPMTGVLAVAYPGWDCEIQPNELDEAVEILLYGLTSESHPIGESDRFEAALQQCVHSCHFFVKERQFQMSSVLWCFDGSLMKMFGIGWTFGWHSKQGQTAQVLTPSSVTIRGAGQVLTASIGLGKLDCLKNMAEIPFSVDSRICFAICSPSSRPHANCSLSKEFLNEFGAEYFALVAPHQATSLLAPVLSEESE